MKCSQLMLMKEVLLHSLTRHIFMQSALARALVIVHWVNVYALMDLRVPRASVVSHFWFYFNGFRFLSSWRDNIL